MSYIISVILLLAAAETKDVGYCYAAAAFWIAGEINEVVEEWKGRK